MGKRKKTNRKKITGDARDYKVAVFWTRGLDKYISIVKISYPAEMEVHSDIIDSVRFARGKVLKHPNGLEVLLGGKVLVPLDGGSGESLSLVRGWYDPIERK